ncbi:hypothetical protein [Mesorhizobium sp. M0802]|uniref:hypothetical protein n=1 Tax=Mesorhizobium sp. M0802 TaxID=2957001 RepID=UPI003338A3B4
MHDLDDAGHQHQPAHDIDRGDGGDEQIAEGNAAEDEQQHAERDEPPPFVPCPADRIFQGITVQRHGCISSKSPGTLPGG